MTYTFDAAYLGAMYEVRIAGERPHYYADGVDALLEFWSNAAADLQRTGIQEVLAISTAKGPVSSDAVLAFYGRLADLPFMPGTRFAIAIPDDASRSLPVIQLGIAVALGKGLDIRTFSSRQSAIEWLGQGGRSSPS